MAHRDGIVTDLRVEESLQMDVPSTDGTARRVTVTLEHKSGQVARLRVQAPSDVVLIPSTHRHRKVQPAG